MQLLKRKKVFCLFITVVMFVVPFTTFAGTDPPGIIDPEEYFMENDVIFEEVTEVDSVEHTAPIWGYIGEEAIIIPKPKEPYTPPEIYPTNPTTIYVSLPIQYIWAVFPGEPDEGNIFLSPIYVIKNEKGSAALSLTLLSVEPINDDATYLEGCDFELYFSSTSNLVLSEGNVRGDGGNSWDSGAQYVLVKTSESEPDDPFYYPSDIVPLPYKTTFLPGTQWEFSLEGSYDSKFPVFSENENHMSYLQPQHYIVFKFSALTPPSNN